MKYGIVIFALISVLFACSSNADKNKSEVEEAKEEGRFGDKITTDNVVAGEKLTSLLIDKDSVWITMKSKVVANCKSSGCWMDLDLGNGRVVKVTFKDYAFAIPTDSEGKIAIIEGFAKKKEISLDMLRLYAKDEGKSMEEIESITEPEVEYTFEAIGVIIE